MKQIRKLFVLMLTLCVLTSGGALAASSKKTAKPKATATPKVTATPEAIATPEAEATANTASMSPVVSISPATLTLAAGKSQRLKVVYSDKKMSSSATVTWSSSDTKAATVNSYGTVQAARAKGSCVITATVKVGKQTYTATCKVTIVVPVTGISLSTRRMSLVVGQTAKLPTVTYTPKNASIRKVVWTVDKKGVVEITSSGRIKAVGLGTAKVTATSAQEMNSRPSASFTVTVTQSVTSITMQKSLKLAPGDTARLKTTVLPKNATDSSVSYSSSNSSVAAVDSNGKVTAKAAGDAVITCTAKDGSGVKATCQVTVRVQATSLTSTVTSPVIVTQGFTRPMMTSVLPTNADPTVSWSVEDDSVATVTDLGLTALEVGETTVTAATTDGSSLTVSFDVVVEPVNPITILGITRTEKSGEGECLYIKPKNLCASRTVSSFRFLVTLADADGEALGEDILCEWAVDGLTIAPGKQPKSNSLHWPKLKGLTTAAKVGITVTKVFFDDNTAETIPEDQRVTLWFE